MSSSAEHVPAPHVTPHVPAEEQVRRQGIQPIASVDELAFPGVWESDEELHDFLADLLRLAARQHAVSLVVLDTDVASASLRDRLPDRLQAALAGNTMCITFVTVGELMKWRVLRNWGPNRTADLARWRQRVGVLEYDEAVAEKRGQLQARAQRPGRPRPHNDTWVAACCLVDDLPLATLNTKDFADFAEHEGLTLIGGEEP